MQPSTSDRPPGLGAEDAAKATVRAFLADTDRQDLQALQKHPGLHETVRYIPSLWAAFPDLRTTIEQQFVSGDVVSTVANCRGTHQGPLFGSPASSKPVSFMLLLIQRIEDDRIVEHWGLADFQAMLTQAGILPQFGPG